MGGGSELTPQATPNLHYVQFLSKFQTLGWHMAGSSFSALNLALEEDQYHQSFTGFWVLQTLLDSGGLAAGAPFGASSTVPGQDGAWVPNESPWCPGVGQRAVQLPLILVL